MSLILKQEPANTIATPPAGKSTLFVNDNSVMSVKSPDGNVTTFPTVQGSNTQVFFNDNGAINGNANLVFNKTSATMTVTNLSVTGNLNAGDINVSSIANGTSNVDIIGASGNVTTSVAGTANVLVVTATGAIVTGTLSSSGNANVGNLGTTGIFSTTLSTSGNANIGNLGVTGTITTTTISGDLLTGAQPNITSTGTLTSLSVSGNANTGNLGTTGVFSTTVSASGNANLGNLGTSLITATGNITGQNIITGGIVSAAGNVSGQFFIGNGSQLSGIDATAIQNGNSNVQVIANSIITASVSGNANVFAILGNGIQANGIVLASGNVTGGNIITGGIVTATGNVTGANVITAGSVFAPAIVANGGAFATQISLNTSTGIIEANTTGNATQFLSSGTIRLPVSGTSQIVGNASDGSIVQLTTDAHLKQLRGGNVLMQVGTDGNVVSTLSFNNNGSLSAPAAVSAVGNVTGANLITAGLVSATGNVSGGNLTTGGLVSATGNITSAANVVTDLIAGRTTGVTITAAGTNQNINLVPTGTGVVNVGNFIISNVASPLASTDAATKQYVDDVAQGLHTHDSCNAATQTTLASISGGTVTYNNGTSGVGATLTTTGTYTTIDGVTLSVGMRILVKNEVTAANNGIYDVTSSTVLTRSADFNTPTEMAGGDFTFVTAGTLYDNTGWVMPDPVTTVGTSPVVWIQFSGAGTYTAGTGLTLTGSQFSITNTAVTPGAYGNGDFNATFTVNQQGQLSAAANVAITANAGNLSGTVLKSTVVTSSLTSVGTLTTLSISGNANVGNIGGGAGIFTTVAGALTTAAQPNVTSVGTLASLGVTGNISAGNVSATTFTGALSGAATSATTAGTVTTAAQPNITSLGTLSSLSVSGNANVGNIGGGLGVYTTLSASGNVNGGNLVSTGSVGGTGATHLGNTFTTGANTTAGTVTGNFALSAGSRFQATYA
jgi:hypothetical protein